MAHTLSLRPRRADIATSRRPALSPKPEAFGSFRKGPESPRATSQAAANRYFQCNPISHNHLGHACNKCVFRCCTPLHFDARPPPPRTQNPQRDPLAVNAERQTRSVRRAAGLTHPPPLRDCASNCARSNRDSSKTAETEAKESAFRRDRRKSFCALGRANTVRHFRLALFGGVGTQVV